MRFLLYTVFDFERHLSGLVGREAVGRELLDAILDGAAAFAENELHPLNRVGDEHGCRLENGVVTTPPGFKEAYRAFVDGGWSGMTGEVAYGGQGLPHSVGGLVEEIIGNANIAWTMYIELSHGAMNALAAHGTEAQKQTFLTRLLAGKWTGTMCLTEPHAGSDVGLLRTRAVPRPDGTYGITGTKIFISAGDHDFTENIVHLVLARLPDAPAGTKGISLFLVPKRVIRPDGGAGAPNGVVCSALEEKMGIHGNSTCVLNFEDATGHLVGPENGGMRCMFTMMNAARVAVGLQGLSLAEAAYQASLRYARERLQMRSLAGPQRPDAAADPIIVHPDVRRMLLTQKAFTEGNRALAYFTMQQADLADFGATAEIRAEATEMLDFMTPIVKAFLTETGYESVNHAVQVFGGHGYIRETGVEQYVRDCRITLIYEGTTQIQALDLLGRKVLATRGKALTRFVGEMNRVADECTKALPEIADELKRIASEWSETTLAIGGRALQSPEEVGAASVDYLMYSGYAVLAYSWARIALAAITSGEHRDAFLEGKLATARFFFARMLPRAEAHRRAIAAGNAPLAAIDDAFGPA
jgi:alkylation response protein AidB-like acyl-CoA dehydrogenase